MKHELTTQAISRFFYAPLFTLLLAGCESDSVLQELLEHARRFVRLC